MYPSFVIYTNVSLGYTNSSSKGSNFMLESNSLIQGICERHVNLGTFPLQRLQI